MHQMETELDVGVPMRDGTVLRADIYRPAGQGPWPVLLQRTPYDKRSFGNWLVIDALAATQRDYIVVHQDTRGRFASDGEWVPWAYEREDGYDTVVWAAAIAGSNGKVGMIGASYTGSTQWSAAIMRPPGLVAIAPMVTWSEPADGIIFRGGAIELGLNAAWGMLQALGQYPKVAESPEALWATFATAVDDFDNLPTRTYWELPSGALPATLRTGQPDIGVARALADPTTMAELRVAGRYDEVRVPSLNVAGWYDVFQQGTIDNYVGARDAGLPARLIIGPWTHGMQSGLFGGQMGEINFGAMAGSPADSPSLTALQLDWFDTWMSGSDASDHGIAPVKIFVMGANVWRDEQEWPLARAEEAPLFLRAGGGLSFSVPDVGDGASTFTYDPADPVLTHGGALVMSSEFAAGPLDQRDIETREDVLVFTGEVLQEDLEVTGRVRAQLYASTSAPSTDWVVRLCDVDEAGRSFNVADGIIRATTVPGAVGEYEVDLWSTSIVFRAGHRVRVHVTSSNFPRWDRNLNMGAALGTGTEMRRAEQTVYMDATRPSCLILPVVAH